MPRRRANLTYDGAEGRGRLSGIRHLRTPGLPSRKSTGVPWRFSCTLGYEIENRRDSKGRAVAFEIRGVLTRTAR